VRKRRVEGVRLIAKCSNQAIELFVKYGLEFILPKGIAAMITLAGYLYARYIKIDPFWIVLLLGAFLLTVVLLFWAALAALIRAYREGHLSTGVFWTTIAEAFLLLFLICSLFLEINYLRDPVVIDPDALFYDELGAALSWKKDYDGAIAEYRQAVKLDPRYALAYDNWGNALVGKKDYDRAIAEYRQAVKLDPKNAVFCDDWGAALVGKKDYDGAIAQVRQAVKLDPKDAVFYDDWGNALVGKKDYDGAIAEYRQAVKLDPKNEMFRADLEDARPAEGSVNLKVN
jgi:tetratricopeptide (TPR) repeat protein